MELYTPQSVKQKREKYLLQAYFGNYGTYGAMWKSDQLTYINQRADVPPLSFKKEFFDIILVVEGAPPYALNGYKLGDPIFDNNPLTEFDFIKNEEHSVSAITTYTQSIEANMGFGPVTAGFKNTFMKSTGTSTTETVKIENIIIPPLSQLDSAGLMWYFYIAPTVVREKWAMQDYNGDNIEPERNLFFFEFHSPQLQSMSYPLTDSIYADFSPRADSLESYYDGRVENMSGVEEVLRQQTDIQIKDGHTGSLELTFSESETNSFSKSHDVTLGIDAELSIFSVSADKTTEFEYSCDRTTTYSNTFYNNWNLFEPKVKEDSNNVISFTPVAHVMKTTDSSAYFLLDGLKECWPYFVTYEVLDIQHGLYLESIYENQYIINKYSFSNYPNPCSNQTNFDYTLSQKSQIELSIYNTLGEKVGNYVTLVQNSGNHQVEVSTLDFVKGVYFYRFQIDEDLITGKIIVNK